MKGANAVVAGVAVGALAAAPAIALARYQGSPSVFIVFNLCFFALFALILPRPRLYVYGFLAALLGLGFWAKVLMHVIWAPGFVEPVGDFANTPAEWDRALMAASAGILGVVAVRLGHLLYAWRQREASEPEGGVPPAWFARWRQPVWWVTVVLVIAVNAANLQFAFFQIGVNPKLILPMRMHVLLAWLVNVGFALWMAALVWWDYRTDGGVLHRVLIAPMIEAFFSSVSVFSRIIYPLHAGPYWLGLYERRKELGTVIKRWQFIKLIGHFLLLFALSILFVFIFRVMLYYGYMSGVPPSEPLRSHVYRTMQVQLPTLIIHRWVGLEGVLTVGATPNLGRALLMEAITDSPKLASRSLYQRMAKVYYLSEHPQDFTFLANAGPVAVLLFSGSLVVVCAGMALIALVLVATEEITRACTGNPFLLAVSGAALANVVGQTTFFYLTLIFFAQLWLAVGFLAVLQRLDSRNSRKG